mgnify:CR=1 FL=1
MEINIFEGKISEEEMSLELERIASLLREGYHSGEIFSDYSTECKNGYRGWWKKDECY